MGTWTILIVHGAQTPITMDAWVKKALIEKIKSAVSNTSEVANIVGRLEGISFASKDDFAYGVAIGRIYNSFHYQTRRILKRNATEEEFGEFLDILRENSRAIRDAVRQ